MWSRPCPSPLPRQPMHCRLNRSFNRPMQLTSLLFSEPYDGFGRHGFTYVDVGAGSSSAFPTRNRLVCTPHAKVPVNQVQEVVFPSRRFPRVRCIRGLTVRINPPTKSSPSLRWVVPSGCQIPCRVRYPRRRTRAAERTSIHVPQSAYRLGSPLSRGMDGVSRALEVCQVTRYPA